MCVLERARSLLSGLMLRNEKSNPNIKKINSAVTENGTGSLAVERCCAGGDDLVMRKAVWPNQVTLLLLSRDLEKGNSSGRSSRAPICSDGASLGSPGV